MKDEAYTSAQSVTLFPPERPFVMDCGRTLAPVTIAYETYGELNAAGDNAVLVCHALTGNAHAGGFASSDRRSAGWWEPLIGPGRGLDISRYFVICSNFLGSCYGTTGPVSVNPSTGRPYGPDFPQMTVRDMVRLQRALLDHIGVRSLTTVIGGSLGGMQVLEWGVMYPAFVRSMIPIATAAQHSPWCIGLNDIARQAIMNDPAWQAGRYPLSSQPRAGLSLARQVAMISYRSDVSFLARFGRERRGGAAPATAAGAQVAGAVSPSGAGPDARFDAGNLFQVESYLRYQGDKLVDRFDANTYIAISRAMDLHDVALGRGDVRDVLGSLTMPALCIGISSDVLYPVHEQKNIAGMIPLSTYREIASPHGHDAFLIEYGQVAAHVRGFLRDHEL
ncbi:MAG: metX [Bacteroidetes bacterium]|nr:metX [Bacteroidota bacterium]